MKKSVFLLIALLLVSCASGAPQATTPAEPSTVEPAATEPVATEPPSPAEPPAAEAPDLAGLQGVVWYLESLLDAQGSLAPVMPGSQVTAEFGADNSVSGSGGCNRYTGGFEVAEGQLKFGPIASTMMACIEPEGLMEQEAAYLKALESSVNFRLSQDKLEMLDGSGNTVLVFTSTPPAADQAAGAEPAGESLTGMVWRWQEFQSSDGSVVKPENPGSYTIEFLPDGKVSIQADCNRVVGTYTVNDSQLTIEARAMTKMACPPGSLSNEFVEYLNNVVSFVFQEGDLYLALKYDSGIMKLSTSEPAGESLTGVVWRWEEFQSSDESVVKPENPGSYTIEFLPDGKVSIQADCNRVVGAYTVDGSQLTIEARAMTLMACPPGSLSDKYMEYLNNVVSLVFKDGNLYLALKYDSGIMKFSASKPAGESLTGGVWRWQEFQSSDGSVVKPKDPQAYTIEFLPDGSMGIQADCNRVLGAYTMNGSQLTIEAQAMTLMACPPGSLSDKYLEYLNGVVSYVFEGGNLFLALKYDSGIMKFTR